MKEFYGSDYSGIGHSSGCYWLNLIMDMCERKTSCLCRKALSTVCRRMKVGIAKEEGFGTEIHPETADSQNPPSSLDLGL